MAQWTPLSKVEENRLAGKTIAFSPSLVWAPNCVARNPYPRKYTYMSCPYRHDNGRLCAKSLEFGPKFDHNLPGQPMYRFQVLMFDAAHAQCPPLKGQLWDAAHLLLKTSALEFSRLSEADQQCKVQSILQKAPMLQVSLYVKGFELKILLLTRLDDGVSSDEPCYSPVEHTMLKTPSKTPRKSTAKLNSAKNLLVDILPELVVALQDSNLED